MNGSSACAAELVMNKGFFFEGVAMKRLDVLAAILVVIGALNWGLVGLFGFNLVFALFGTTVLTNLVYILVGLSGVYQAVQIQGIQRRWSHATA